MSEKISVSKKPARKANSLQQQGKPDRSTNNSKVKQPTSPILDAPCSFILDPTGLFNERFIKNPHYQQPFTRLAEPVFATSAVLKNYDAYDGYFYCDCYLLPGEPAHDPSWHVHPLALHPCAFQTGETFILLQILERASGTSATWEQSLAEALSVPIGQWLQIGADHEQVRVEYELLEPQLPEIPEYPEFLADVLQLAVSVEIPELEHQIRSLMGGSTTHYADCGRPIAEH